VRDFFANAAAVFFPADISFGARERKWEKQKGASFEEAPFSYENRD